MSDQLQTTQAATTEVEAEAPAHGVVLTDIAAGKVQSLLAQEGVAVFAAYREGQIVAGMIANRTGEVVGLSNMFVTAHDADGLRSGSVAQAMESFPGLPLVGYEAGEDLAAMRALVEGAGLRFS